VWEGTERIEARLIVLPFTQEEGIGNKQPLGEYVGKGEGKKRKGGVGGGVKST